MKFLYEIITLLQSVVRCITDLAFSLQLAPFPSRLFRRDQILILQSQRLLSSFTTVDKRVIVYVISPYVNGIFFSHTPLLRTLANTDTKGSPEHVRFNES